MNTVLNGGYHTDWLQTAWRTGNLVGGNGPATLSTQSGIRTCEVDNSRSLIGYLSKMSRGFGIVKITQMKA